MYYKQKSSLLMEMPSRGVKEQVWTMTSAESAAAALIAVKSMSLETTGLD